MGSAESIMDETTSIVQQTETKQSSNCKCSADDVVGDISEEMGPGCPALPIHISQKASANCSCDMTEAIQQLADASNKLSQSAKSALSGAMSMNSADLNTSVKVNQALTQACSVDSDADATVKSIDIKQESCIGMNDEALKLQQKAAININQSTSVQGQCLSSIASKTASKASDSGDQKATTENFLTQMFQSAMGALSSLFAMGPIIAVVVVGGSVIVGVMKLKGSKSSDSDDSMDAFEDTSFNVHNMQTDASTHLQPDADMHDSNMHHDARAEMPIFRGSVHHRLKPASLSHLKRHGIRDA